jgi:hypothetical protein
MVENLNTLLCFSSIKGKTNFLQLSWFPTFCEQFFGIRFENRFNFQRLFVSDDLHKPKPLLPAPGSGEKIIWPMLRFCF